MIDRRPFIRPSNVPSLAICPAKALMEARAVDRCPELLGITHPQAQQGNVGHDLVAQTISMIYGGEGWLDPQECLSKMDSAISKLDPWSADASRRCVNYAVALVDRQVANGFRCQVFAEMQLPGAFLGITRGGTADVVILCRKEGNPNINHVVVQDHKLGFLDQGEAAEHLQLWAYAAMAWNKYEPAESVEIHLAQGRRRDFSAATFDKTAIDNAISQIKNIVFMAQSSSPVVKPHIDACRYCKSLCLCTSAQEEIMKASEELALFGVSDENRVRLAEMAQIAGRFSEEVKLLQKEWVKTAQSQEIEF